MIDKPLKIPDEHPKNFNKMPDGLDGYWWETENIICIPVVFAQNQGSGALGKWLSELELKHKIILFPTVISRRLIDILIRHNYKLAFVYDSNFKEAIECLALDCRLEEVSYAH